MRYTVFGFSLEAEMDVPEIARVESGVLAPADMQIEWGRLPEELCGGRKIFNTLEAKDRDILYTFEDIGRFLVSDGKRIVVDKLHSAADSDMRAFLFGSVMGTALHQRSLIPLHISAVRSPKGLVAFTGPSGVGKSTTAAQIYQRRGWKLFCDDVAVLRSEDETPLLFSGIRRLKLWNDAISRLGLGEVSSVRDLARFDKFHLLAPEFFDDRPDQLMEVNCLQPQLSLCNNSELGVSTLRGAEKFAGVLASVYRMYLAEITGNSETIWRKCSTIAKTIRVRRMNRESLRFDSTLWPAP